MPCVALVQAGTVQGKITPMCGMLPGGEVARLPGGEGVWHNLWSPHADELDCSNRPPRPPHWPTLEMHQWHTYLPLTLKHLWYLIPNFLSRYKKTFGNYYHVTMPPRHHVIISSCHLVSFATCQFASISINHHKLASISIKNINQHQPASISFDE